MLPQFQSLVSWRPSWRVSRSALWRGLPTKTGSPPQKLYIPGTCFRSGKKRRDTSSVFLTLGVVRWRNYPASSPVLSPPFFFAIWLSLTEQQNLLSCHRDPVDLLQSVSITISQQGEQMGAGPYHSVRTRGGGRAPKQSIRERNLRVFLRNNHFDMFATWCKTTTPSPLYGNSWTTYNQQVGIVR